ncbi:unnamed protein product [uncultured bacterium]|nr:unnamed protein product [uncultured bacterium]
MSAEGRTVAIERTRDGYPPLMVVFRRRLNEFAIRNVKEGLTRAMDTGKPFILEDTAQVFQMIDGRWETLLPEESPAG